MRKSRTPSRLINRMAVPESLLQRKDQRKSAAWGARVPKVTST
jgi:hypothetical protein